LDPETVRVPAPELLRALVPLNSTPALPLLNDPESAEVPVIVSEPLPELVTDAPKKDVPTVEPDPLVLVDVPLTATLPPVTPKPEDAANLTPLLLADTPLKERLPDTVLVPLRSSPTPLAEVPENVAVPAP
jgi:hypothetical protein